MAITKNKTIINDGILETYLLDTYSSKHNQKVAIGVLTNIVMNQKSEYPQDILKTMGMEYMLMGSGANTLTGDYSRGAFGYLVETEELLRQLLKVASNLVVI